jgi:hypothetical protein
VVYLAMHVFISTQLKGISIGFFVRTTSTPRSLARSGHVVESESQDPLLRWPPTTLGLDLRQSLGEVSPLGVGGRKIKGTSVGNLGLLVAAEASE